MPDASEDGGGKQIAEAIANGRVAEAFERLVDAVLDTRLIPFVGAGLSVTAPYHGGDARPTTEDLAQRLAKDLSSRADSCAAVRRNLEGGLGRALGQRPQWQQAVAGLGLPWLAEQVIHLGQKYADLCKIVGIERFLQLGPSPAHRYLAFLAREGRVKEIVTTNYDRCLEKAFDESTVGRTVAEQEARRLVCAVVCDLDTNKNRKAGGEPGLTVYKINGCASSFREGDEESARHIVLTELDLQAWHGEGWARQLFSERLTQNSLILTGFGAEEAQVRFAVTALSEDFRKKAKPVSSKRVASEANAPFVQEFRPDLNRFQQQVLFAWFEARSSDEGEDCEARIAAIQANAFTGRDSGFFGEETNLTADAFWEAVFMAAWRRLLEQNLRERCTEALAPLTTPWHIAPEELAKGVCNALFEAPSTRSPYCSLLALEPQPSDSQAMLPLVRCVEAMEGGNPSGAAAGRYLALRDNSRSIGYLALFLAWSRAESGELPSAGVLSTQSRLGLRLPRRAGDLETCLASHSLVLAPDLEEPKETASTFVRIVLRARPELRQVRDTWTTGAVAPRLGLEVDAAELLCLVDRQLAAGIPGARPGGPDGWPAFRVCLDWTLRSLWTRLQPRRASDYTEEIVHEP
jgi:hypothetical protein